MELKTLEQAKSIREKKKELESKIADIAKSDPERAKKMSIALTVLSGKADRMIGDGLGGDKEMVALAPREEPISAPVASKPYIAAVRKRIQPKGNPGDDMLKYQNPAKDLADPKTIVYNPPIQGDKSADPVVKIKSIDISKDIIPTKKLETEYEDPYKTLMEKKRKNGGIIPGGKYLTDAEKAIVDRMFM